MKEVREHSLALSHGVAVVGFIAAIWGASIAASAPVAADTVEFALVQAYQNNPQLNVQRAVVRVTDEQVPASLSGYRPRITATATGGAQSLDTTQTFVQTPGAPGTPPLITKGSNTPYSAGITLSQTIFNGFQTANRTRAAESQVSSARETLRDIERKVLLDAITAYMNVLRDFANLELQKRNVAVLQQQLRETRDRFKVGDVTETDISQAESRLAAGQTQVETATANYQTSVATYRQVIGSEPGRLSPGSPIDRFCPPTLNVALNFVDQHPVVTTAMYNVDLAEHVVQATEGQLLPNLQVLATAQKNWEQFLNIPQSSTLSILGQLSVPIYQGGVEYAAVRGAKETLGQRRLELDVGRLQVRQGIVQAWSQLEAAKAAIKSTETQARTAEKALNGVREEARVGQRTTLDVLNAQQELVNARVAVVNAQRDRIVASYTVLSAVGGLSARTLGLPVKNYDAGVHYQQVRDSWVGLRTPDGK